MVKFLDSIFGENMAHAAGEGHEFVELDWDSAATGERLVFRTIDVERYVDVDKVVDSLRDKRSIILMRIKTKMANDKTEVRRAIRRVQKSVYAVGGDIIGLSEEMILVTPPIVRIERDKESARKIEEVKSQLKAES